jgi:hypothetical protein
MSLLLLSRTGFGLVALASVALLVVAVAQVWRRVD